ncbi:SH3 and cysteine-rich domain-containing protein 2-like isoform X3 [Clinocottus analis]|uniref:SH3 and cysteine-rich domain-containing protein 2-like isoform X3 n=1 Tax=Clinocottus analis TaxID=304258 RepID=UPI0035C06557
MTEISEKENEPQNLHRPHTTVPSQPESKLQRLKRSLSFKSVMRSKSVDNFFQRSNGDSRPHSALITLPPPPPSPPPVSESPLAYERSPSHSPSTSPNPSLSSRSPSISPSKSMNFKTQQKSQAQPVKTHCFQEHVFRRPASCQRCKHMIQGNSKQGLRCKACKLATHLWCSSELSQQPCNGKTGAFKRNFSSPLLTTDTLGVVREAPAAQEADNGIVDPVYEALRYGTSLAQMSRSSFSSISESPCHEEEQLQDKLENQPIAEEEHIPGSLATEFKSQMTPTRTGGRTAGVGVSRAAYHEEEKRKKTDCSQCLMRHRKTLTFTCRRTDREKAETSWDCSRPTLCSGSALVSVCGRSQMVSMATETKAR